MVIPRQVLLSTCNCNDDDNDGGCDDFDARFCLSTYDTSMMKMMIYLWSATLQLALKSVIVISLERQRI